MKALIISDDTRVINSLKLFLEDKGFDTIVYRWLLKAMDNVEEIRPDCIVVSSSEYPRHWKTLVQFAKSGIGGDRIGIFLYEPTPMSDEDLEKVNLLGVNGMFTDFSAEQLAALDCMLNDFYGFETEEIKSPVIEDEATENEVDALSSEILNQVQDDTAAVQDDESVVQDDAAVVQDDVTTVQEDTTVVLDDVESEDEMISVDAIQQTEPETEVSGTGYYMMNHPVTNAFITGTYFCYGNGSITCKVNPGYEFEAGANLKYFSFMYKGECNSYKAKIANIMNINDEKLLVIELSEQYENL